MGFVLVSAMFAGAATASVVSCKNGEYDGSYDGSFDASGTAVGGGSSVSRVVQPGSSETVASSDGAFDVTFAPGTFASPAKITVTFVGERTLDMGLIVPIYSVTSDQQPTKFIQVDFHGKDNGGGGSQPPVPAI